jgi:hypothetical protein
MHLDKIDTAEQNKWMMQLMLLESRMFLVEITEEICCGVIMDKRLGNIKLIMQHQYVPEMDFMNISPRNNVNFFL